MSQITQKAREIATPSTAAREAASDFIRGNGPWKEAEINLPDDDYAVQAFARFERRTLEALRTNFYPNCKAQAGVIDAQAEAKTIEALLADKARLRWEAATGRTIDEQRANLSQAMRDAGDCKLIWVNEGDLLVAAPTGDRTMTEIEKKALALVNEVLAERELPFKAQMCPLSVSIDEALCRAIEKHEADKAAHAATVEGILKAHEAFKQEVSDAIYGHFGAARIDQAGVFRRFILAKPDIALAEALSEAYLCDGDGWDAAATHLREALAKRGLKIVEV